MGWLRGDLTRLRRLPVFADAAPAPAAETPLPETPAGGANARDAALLEQLEILLDLELLEGWDPEADLPIPVTPGPVRAKRDPR